MAPPAGGHYRMNNLSNPYNHYPQQHTQFQPQSNYNAQSFGGHAAAGGFGASQANAQMNIFGGGLQNGGGQAGVGGGAGGFNAGGAGGSTSLASHEAQMRFAHGAALQRQQQQQQQVDGDLTAGRGVAVSPRIREVWASNLDEEFHTIRSLIDRYPYISMDTEFPGIVARPMGNFPSKADYHYQTLRCNVDLLKLIQLGITLWSPEGELPPTHIEAPFARSRGHQNGTIVCPCTWTFNFKFSLEEDMSSETSIEMLKKAGVDFDKCARVGIDPKIFGARLVDSGLVLQRNVTWLSFHSGYDFGYLVKIMFPASMPEDDEKYLSFVQEWFKRIYDIKYLLRATQVKARNGTLHQQASEIITALGPRSGLQDLADELGCKREGLQHTAGSDAWLTGAVFWAMRSKIFDGKIADDNLNRIWGLSSVGLPASATSAGGQGNMIGTPGGQGSVGDRSDLTPTTYRSDNPTTPKNAHSGLTANSTPSQHGSMGLPGGAFNFLYGGGR